MSQDFNREREPSRDQSRMSERADRADLSQSAEEQPLQQEGQGSGIDWGQIANAAANLANQASLQMTTPQPSPIAGPLENNPPLADSAPREQARQAEESQAEAHEDVPPSPATGPHAAENNPDVEYINGHAVGFAFLRYYKAHPEIGLPVEEQQGDVGGSQTFEHAVLRWDSANVQVENRES